MTALSSGAVTVSRPASDAERQADRFRPRAEAIAPEVPFIEAEDGNRTARFEIDKPTPTWKITAESTVELFDIDPFAKPLPGRSIRLSFPS